MWDGYETRLQIGSIAWWFCIKYMGLFHNNSTNRFYSKFVNKFHSYFLGWFHKKSMRWFHIWLLLCFHITHQIEWFWNNELLFICNVSYILHIMPSRMVSIFYQREENKRYQKEWNFLCSSSHLISLCLSFYLYLYSIYLHIYHFPN